MFLLFLVGYTRRFGGNQYEMGERELVVSTVPGLGSLQNWKIQMLGFFLPGCLLLSKIWAVVNLCCCSTVAESCAF